MPRCLGVGASWQVELHPYLSQDKLLRLCRQHGIALVGFSSLASASYVQIGMAQASESLLSLPALKALGKKYARTPAQVVLRWAVQRGTAIIPVRGFVACLRPVLVVRGLVLSEARCWWLVAAWCWCPIASLFAWVLVADCLPPAIDLPLLSPAECQVTPENGEASADARKPQSF